MRRKKREEKCEEHFQGRYHPPPKSVLAVTKSRFPQGSQHRMSLNSNIGYKASFDTVLLFTREPGGSL
jgi:hypothetical protein